MTEDADPRAIDATKRLIDRIGDELDEPWDFGGKMNVASSHSKHLLVADAETLIAEARRRGIISRAVNDGWGEALWDQLADALEELHTWTGLMSLLDEHYPDDIWLPGADSETMDPGHRVVAAIRRVDKLRTVEQLATPRMVSSVAELDALPLGSLIDENMPDRLGFHLWKQGSGWNSVGGIAFPSKDVVLPATVLYAPVVGSGETGRNTDNG